MNTDKAENNREVVIDSELFDVFERNFLSRGIKQSNLSRMAHPKLW